MADLEENQQQNLDPQDSSVSPDNPAQSPDHPIEVTGNVPPEIQKNKVSDTVADSSIEQMAPPSLSDETANAASMFGQASLSPASEEMPIVAEGAIDADSERVSMNDVHTEEATEPAPELDENALVLNEYHCPECGEIMLALPEFPLVGCMFCCSSFGAVEAKHALLWEPDAIVPFTVDKGLFFETILRWMAEGELTPDDIFRQVYLDLAEELYLPFYLFEGNYSSTYSAAVGQEKYDPDTKETMIDWDRKTGQVSGKFFLLQYGGQGSLPDDIVEFLEAMPIDASMVESFEKFVIQEAASAFKPFDLESETVYEQKTGAILEGRVEKHIREHINSEHIDDLSITPVIERSVLSAYLPVWLLAYRYKDDIYYTAIDGMLAKKAKTPRIHGKKPQDAHRELLLDTLYFPLKLWTALGAVILLIILLTMNLTGWWQFIVVIGYLAFVLGIYRKTEVRRATMLKESRERRNLLLRHLHQKCIGILTSTWRTEYIDKMHEKERDVDTESDDPALEKVDEDSL